MYNIRNHRECKTDLRKAVPGTGATDRNQRKKGIPDDEQVQRL